jgi:hypothetical protein
MCSNCTSYADKLGKKPKQSEMGYCFQCKHPPATDDANSDSALNPSRRNDGSIGKRIPKRPSQLCESDAILRKSALPPPLAI